MEEVGGTAGPAVRLNSPGRHLCSANHDWTLMLNTANQWAGRPGPKRDRLHQSDLALVTMMGLQLTPYLEYHR